MAGAVLVPAFKPVIDEIVFVQVESVIQDPVLRFLIDRIKENTGFVQLGKMLDPDNASPDRQSGRIIKEEVHFQLLRWQQRVLRDDAGAGAAQINGTRLFF